MKVEARYTIFGLFKYKIYDVLDERKKSYLVEVEKDKKVYLSKDLFRVIERQ